MPITAADVQRVITLRVGDIDPATGDPPVSGGAGMVASNISTLWAIRADKAQIAPRLQELYVQRDALDMIVALLRHQVDVVQGDPQLSVRMSQRVAVAENQRQATDAEITLIEKRAALARGGAVGQINQRTPVSVQDELNRRRQWPIIPDPSDPRYAGSPFERVRREGF